MKRLLFFILCAFLIINATEAFGQSEKFGHLNHLIKKGNYLDAAVETVHLSAYTPGIPPAEFNYLERVLRYKNADYRYVIKRTDGKSSLRETLLLSQSYFHLHNYDSARSVLSAAPEKNDPNLLLVKTYQSIMLFDFSSASLLARQLSEQNTKYKSLNEQLSKYKNIKTRSPAASALLSTLLPGAGQLYSGRFSDALLSFSLTASAGAGTYYLYRNNHKSWSYLTAFMAVLFYAGNIIGGYHSAEKYNYENRSTFTQSILKNNSFYEGLDFADRRIVR